MTFIVAYVLYVATETSTSGWIASQLHGEGFSASIASLATGGFWMGLALGRTAGGQLHKRVSERALVLGSLMICSILSLVAYSHELSPYVYPLIGLALSSVYPMGLIWYTKLCPNDSDGLALIMFFMMAGGIIGPAFESLMVAAIGIHVVSVVIGVIAVLDVVAFSFALRYREHDGTKRNAAHHACGVRPMVVGHDENGADVLLCTVSRSPAKPSSSPSKPLA
jgi:fucose permease